MTRGSTPRGLLSLAAIAMIAVALACAVLLTVGEEVHQAPARADAPAAGNGLRVYVVVLDGLKPDEIRAPLTPRLVELKNGGTWYQQARAVYPAETLPNHAAMMTGVLPQRSGIVGNDFWRPNESGVSKYRMQQPEQLGADTLVTRLENRCQVSTATIMSKGYLWALFRGEPVQQETDGRFPVNEYPQPPHPGHPGNQRQADYHWKPIGQNGYIGDPDDHVVDQTTMNEGVLEWVDSDAPTPQFAFINLGDIDRSGHVDATGVAGGVSAARQAALADTDNLIGKLVDDLKASGAWEETVLIFTSDHGMDWSAPDNATNGPQQTPKTSVNITTPLFQAGYASDVTGAAGKSGGDSSPGDFVVVPGGGTAAVYLEDDGNVADVASRIDKLDGIAAIATRQPVPGLSKPNPTLHAMGMDDENNGDIVVLVKEGWAVRDPSSANPLPGNHGHPVTQHSTLFVTGGSPLLDSTPESVDGELVYDPEHKAFSPPGGGPGNLSIAPTVAALFGIGPTVGGYDGPELKEAFKPYALQAHQPCGAASPPGPPTENTGPPDTTGTADTSTPVTTDSGTPDTGDTGTIEVRGTKTTHAVAPVPVPKLTQLTVSPTAFLPRASRPRAARKGATVRYGVTQAAQTTFTVWRQKRGHRRGYVRVRGSFAHTGVAGTNTVPFTGWVGGRRLAPGLYRLRAVASNSAGKSRVAQTSFRIKGPWPRTPSHSSPRR